MNLRKRKVRPLIIVELDGLTRCELRLFAMNKALPKHILQFENAIDPFSHRIAYKYPFLGVFAELLGPSPPPADFQPPVYAHACFADSMIDGLSHTIHTSVPYSDWTSSFQGASVPFLSPHFYTFF